MPSFLFPEHVDTIPRESGPCSVASRTAWAGITTDQRRRSGRISVRMLLPTEGKEEELEEEVLRAASR